MPTFDEIMFLSTGGGILPGYRTANYLWTRTPSKEWTTGSTGEYVIVELNQFDYSHAGYTNVYNIRCIRHAIDTSSITVSSSGGGSSSSGGSGNVVSSGFLIAISAESASQMTFNNAMLYCDTLNENNYQDWILPTIDDMTFLNSGGIDFTDIKTEEYLWTESLIQAGSYANYNYIIKLNNELTQNASISYTYQELTSDVFKTRCHERGAVTVSSSGGGSSSGGSSIPSTLGNGMPTMISNQSDSVMSVINAALYCANLQESGYDDWILPNFDQLSYAISGGCVFNDQRTPYYLWSRTSNSDKSALVMASDAYTGSVGGYWGF